MRAYDEHTLDNGIRLIHKRVTGTRVAHCGIHLDIGSRDEKENEQGIAHFWEHMAFKGTKRRKAYHILNRLDSVGGELNAYTTKEKICFYASVLTNFFPSAFDLLTDITFDSVFPEKQIENERNVILEEMAMYRDSPEDAIQDDFDDVIFSGHSLGRNILGTSSSIKSFHRDDFKKFISQNIDTHRIIFSSIGDIPFSKVVRLANKYLDKIPEHRSLSTRDPYKAVQPTHELVHKKISQAHCAIGRTSYSIKEEKRLPFYLLINLLGGPGMNSRLNLSLRERKGFVYSVDAQLSSFTDTGMFGVFFATEPRQLEKAKSLVFKELALLQTKPLGHLQLHRAKEQLMGQLAMAEENNLSFMLMMGKSMLDLDRIQPLEEIFDKVKAVSAMDLMEVANEMFDQNDLSSITYYPN